MLKRILETSGKKAFLSAQSFNEAAEKLGYSQDEIIIAIKEFDGFPLDDDDLLDVVGGVYRPQSHGNWGGLDSEVF